ncbi:amidase signature (AS) enzyme-1 [Coleophoma crateriformis]|uniref:Amidase signature (AS) enzyme-1 n=1 Tax=Coleophoma crateriformis TaxID=565419 RepID=A0A3D8QUZ2_9HELO|nr:amidase signature (AS) enzyme-1 [Coleophoma crateriformis]
MTEPWKLTATEASKLLRKGDLTVEEYAKSLLSRIEVRDPIIKAWAYLDRDFILDQARTLDSVPESDRGPLHGIPIGIKDVILTKDMPTHYNSRIYASHPIMSVDAAPVITLRAAGALIFGKTATTEFAATMEGGPCGNAHDPARTPGGSSSGSAAAVGDFQVPISLGTQTFGSVIRPAGFNGIYGLKVTWGAISREGLAQYSMTTDTLGFFTRSVADLELLSQVFQLADDAPVPSSPFSLEGAKIAFCKTPVWAKAGPGTIAAYARSQDILKSKGALVSELELPKEFERLPEWHGKILAGEGRTSFLGNYLLAKDKMATSFAAMVENKTQLSRKAQLEAYDGCARCRWIWDEIAEEYDVIITPSTVDEAPLGLSSTGDASFNAIWTILQGPVLNVPGFKGENGMPVGLTLVTARYRDLHLLHVGKAVGAVFTAEGGYKHKLL